MKLVICLHQAAAVLVADCYTFLNTLLRLCSVPAPPHGMSPNYLIWPYIECNHHSITEERSKQPITSSTSNAKSHSKASRGALHHQRENQLIALEQAQSNSGRKKNPQWVETSSRPELWRAPVSFVRAGKEYRGTEVESAVTCGLIFFSCSVQQTKSKSQLSKIVLTHSLTDIEFHSISPLRSRQVQKHYLFFQWRFLFSSFLLNNIYFFPQQVKLDPANEYTPRLGFYHFCTLFYLFIYLFENVDDGNSA